MNIFHKYLKTILTNSIFLGLNIFEPNIEDCTLATVGQIRDGQDEARFIFRKLNSH